MKNKNETPQEAIFMGYKAKLVALKTDIKTNQERAIKATQDAESFRDMMPTSEEFFADCGPEDYEPNCYDGTYSEM